MLLTMTFCSVITITILKLTMLIMMIMKKYMYMNKMTQFECGFNLMSNKRLPFSSHFFLFLIFMLKLLLLLLMN